MGRPIKWRRIDQIPPMMRFVPSDKIASELEEVVLLVEEYEAIRLKDLESLDQKRADYTCPHCQSNQIVCADISLSEADRHDRNRRGRGACNRNCQRNCWRLGWNQQMGNSRMTDENGGNNYDENHPSG